MSMPTRISVEFGEVFPHGLYAVSEVTESRDFDKSTKDNPVQATDEPTGLRIWQVDVMDADPEARKAERQFTVKLLAKVQPVLPEKPKMPAGMPELPFTPIELGGLTATPYVDRDRCTGTDPGKHRCKARQAWSFRATEVKAVKFSTSSSKSAA
ncbi:MAG: plasmid replication, integration and excision activator [Propionibacteriales bacterium]|nr:plasmid replication, integration and excision activator [Propionibacteriales bacterium]